MKNNSNSILKGLLIIAIIILLCSGMVWLVDQGFNGAFKEWFYSKFYIEPDYLSQGKIGVIFYSWSSIKLFIICLFIVFFTILLLCIIISSYLSARNRSKTEISFIANEMKTSLSSTDEITLPIKYSEIETQLIKIKSVSQKQQQLMQMEMQRKSDVITYLAHDLKTPLASVIGYMSLLDEAPDLPAEQKSKYTGVALEKAYRLEELINEFFDITRFNLQSIVLNKGKINLTFMLQQLADEFYPMLTPQGKQIAIHAPEDLILIADADKLARVFNNIIKNAIAYSYDDSIIDITAALLADKITITFTNHGDPIPSQKLEMIFEKFYRLDSARSSNTGGAGLGLAIAQEIVLAHDGTISVESSIEQTTFSLILPQ